MDNKIKFKLRPEKFNDLVDKLDDLTKIDDTVKIKIDNENILLYSMMGGNVMLAFKNYLINTQDYLEMSNDIGFSIDLIIANCKKFVKNLAFIKDTKNTTLQITYKESPDDDSVMNARSLQIVSGKLKVNWIAGEHFEMRDINKSILNQRLDLRNKKWSFKIEVSDFNDVKKLSSINGQNIVNIQISNGKVVLSESASWELEVDEIDVSRNGNLMLNKRFLNCINSDVEKVEFHIFETFMLIKDESSNLMLSFEQNFEDD